MSGAARADGRVLGVDHLGIAVPDAAAARQVFEGLLGLPVVAEEDVPEQRVHVIKLDAGGTHLELLESTDADGPIGKYVARRGAGIHHLTLRVRDLDGMLADLAARGVELIDRTPRIGAGGVRIAFLHPRSTAGILVELCEAGG